jgi:hypothetical protein
LLGTFSLLGLPGCLPTAAAQQAPDSTMVYTYLEQMPTLPSGGGQAAMATAIAQRVVLPAGSSELASRVFIRFIIEKNGVISSPEVIKGAGPIVDAAVLAAVRQLPTLNPGRQGGQSQRVITTLSIILPTVAGRTLATQQREEQAWQQRQTRRLPGETDSAFVRRVLPVSYAASRDLLAYAWRPSAFGKQLFFSTVGSNREGNAKACLVVLDPYEPDTYAVQRLFLDLEADCDELPTLNAVFFADLDQDGNKELLALAACHSRLRAGTDADGVGQFADVPHYRTLVYHHSILTIDGYPYYPADPTPRPYLNGLKTVAAVRQALAAHQRREPSRPVGPHPNSTTISATKKATAASPPRGGPGQ